MFCFVHAGVRFVKKTLKSKETTEQIAQTFTQEAERIAREKAEQTAREKAELELPPAHNRSNVRMFRRV